MKNFKKISELSKDIENAYMSCLKDIPKNTFTQNLIDDCLGKESITV